MVEQLLVHFTTAGPDADRRLVREYVLDAVDRLAGHPDCDGIGFVPAGQKPGVDGLVLVSITGQPDAVVATERDRWEALVDEGFADGWTTESVDPAEQWGENGATLRARLETLAARISTLVYESLESPLEPVDAHPAEAEGRESPTGVGWWTLLHLLTLQQGYSYRAEIDAHTEGLRSAVHHAAEYEGTDAAVSVIEEVIGTLETTREEIERSV